ncbi:MAG: LPS-assembly protein LptD, partial [Candidatus Hydrogenedentes bacterium]|nr:LPS-assembly protein LptD [Candidatus Hydrogenedentota bacterium]
MAIVSLIAAPGRTALAQSDFREFSAGAQLRDAVIDADAGCAYLAAYNRNEVRRVDLASGEATATVEVGKGPVALALSGDGAILACANRLSGTVSLIRVDDMSVVATVETGAGPAGVAAAPGGGFIVANTFADNAVRIDPAHPDAPVALAGVSGVPNGVAASESLVAVVVRVPASLILFESGAQSPAGTVALSGPAAAICALPGDRFVVAGPSKLVVIDGKARQVIAERDVAAYDVAARGDRIVVLTESGIEVVDGSLKTVEQIATGIPVQAVAADGDLTAALSPATKAWRLHGYPAPVPARPAAERAPRPGAEPAPDTHTARVERVPLGAEAPTARDTSGRPAPTVLGDRDEQTLAESIEAGLELGPSEGGFQPPDWTQPLRDLSAVHVDRQEEGNRIVATDDVKLTLDTVQFESDYLYFDRTTGELTVRGNVVMSQGESRAYADEIRYVLNLDDQADAPPPLSADDEDVEQALARKMFALGSLDATNIEIIEPARDLSADRLIYDFASETGEAYNVTGRSGTFYFGGESIKFLGPDLAAGEHLWLTTCDPEHEYYKVRVREATVGERGAIVGKGAQLQLGSVKTPVYWPRWSFRGGAAPTVGFDFDSGKSAELGYYVNIGQQFSVTPNVRLGYRFWPTTDEGIGLGLEGEYDFMEMPASPLFRSTGRFRTLYTTEDSGHFEWYHRQEIFDTTVVLAQVEQWFDPEFMKDFYYDEYHDRSEPRTFVNVTHTKPTYIATATVRQETNGFVAETERAPEVTYHLLERRLAENLYFTFDTIDGYNEREPAGTHALRFANVARVTYDLEAGDAFNLTPFAEVEGTWYSHTTRGGDSDLRLSSTLGSTIQTRLHRTYAGRWGFSEFKHLVVPSVTFSYRPSATM